jgi:hypothetical protein
MAIVEAGLGVVAHHWQFSVLDASKTPMWAQPCGAGFDEISAAMMTSARKARKKRRAVMPGGYLAKRESLAMAGGLDLFPAKFTVLGCEEIRPSIKAVSAKHPYTPDQSRPDGHDSWISLRARMPHRGAPPLTRIAAT